jgi:hypothetical protein
MVVKFRNTICPPPPQHSLHRRAALSSNSNGTRSVYKRKNPKAVYIVICLCYNCMLSTRYAVQSTVWGEIKTKYSSQIFCKWGEGEVSLQKKKERIVHLELILFRYLSPETDVLPAIPLALGVQPATPSPPSPYIIMQMHNKCQSGKLTYIQ